MAALKYWNGTTWVTLGDPISAVTADVNFGGYKATLLADPTAAQDAATKAYVDIRGQIEGNQLYTTPAGDFTIPNGAWSTPATLDWHGPIIVGPNQMWEITAVAAPYCVTAAHRVYNRVAIRDSSNATVPIGAISYTQRATSYQPPVITTPFTMVCYSRLTTDGTVAPNTTLRVSQEFFGSGANGRVIRDGNQCFIIAWRRA